MIPLEEVYKEYSDMIFRWILARTGSEHVAEEITQETFYQAVLHADSYDYSCKVSTWLCSIASNKLKEYYRKNPVLAEAEENDAVAEGPEAAVIADAQRLELYRAIHLLPEPAREVVHLRAFGDLSFREIGDIFGKTENWARVTYYRAKTALRKELEKNE
ncbi:MAG: sigma-70 family RNA polymerase sigma factor [Firmicutes bacterium]|nr:sigma-70 family RNA polymerase sigma factor [Bacillota bacterium]MBR6236130.1 sigma-70 family RNA polymerase sigma factor [Bacillota bacterium]